MMMTARQVGLRAHGEAEVVVVFVMLVHVHVSSCAGAGCLPGRFQGGDGLDQIFIDGLLLVRSPGS